VLGPLERANPIHWTWLFLTDPAEEVPRNPSPEEGNSSSSRNLVFFRSSQSPERWPKSETPVTPSVIPHRQTPSECIRFLAHNIILSATATECCVSLLFLLNRFRVFVFHNHN
jgi:CCR4-NOT transcriptional regulation complex NOT5 subunit